jgi:hypothetical protein
MMLADLFWPNPDCFARKIGYNNLLSGSSFSPGIRVTDRKFI